jgi:hypothetical protein
MSKQRKIEAFQPPATPGHQAAAGLLSDEPQIHAPQKRRAILALLLEVKHLRWTVGWLV